MMQNKKQWWIEHWHIVLAFVIPFLIMLGVYASYGVYPFGDGSVLVLDLNGQYVSYFEAFRDAVLHGKSLLYSHSRSLSGEMLGIVAYYLASPFSLLVLMFPRANITEALFLMTLLKIACAGLTFALYLKRKPLPKTAVVMLSISYALSAYSVVQVMNIMWMDGVLALPLLMLSIEQLVEEHKTTLFTGVLIYLFITNYYIAYMTGILCFFYFMYYRLLINKRTVQQIVLFFRQTLIAILCTAWLLIPTAYSLTLGKSEFSKPNISLFSKFTFLDFFAKLLPSTYDSVNIEGLPFVYASILMLVFVIVYFANKTIPQRQRIVSGVFLIGLIVLMNVSVFDLAMHGFQNPNWLNYRYSFFVSFFGLSLCARALEHRAGITKSLVLKAVLGVGGFVILVQAMDYSFVSDESTIWLSLCSLFLYALFLSISTSSKRYRLFQGILILVMAGELTLNAITSLDRLDYEVLYSTRESYAPYMKEIRLPLSKIAYDDPGMYRIEKTFHRTVNDPMSLGIRGLSHSTSTLHAKAITLLQRLGFSARDHWTKYLGATPVTDAIFGVRYVLTKEIPVDYYELKFRLESISAYYNKYALSLGFGASKNVVSLDMNEQNPFVLQNKLLSRLVGWDDTDFFEEVAIQELVLENVSHSKIAGHDTYKEIDGSVNAQIEFILGPSANPIYAYFPSNYEREVNLWLDHEWLDTFFGNESYRIMSLGANNQVRSLIMTITNREVYLKENTPYFYQLNAEKFAQAMAILASQNLQLSSYSETKLEGSVSMNRDGVFFTTLPFEKGWSIAVDGKKVDYYEVADALIGFDLPAGEHRITMHFFPYGMKLGLLLGVIGLALWWWLNRLETSVAIIDESKYEQG